VTLAITAGPFQFRARMEEGRAPHTCAAFARLLPFRQKVSAQDIVFEQG
jgi:hypothetical protein